MFLDDRVTPILTLLLVVIIIVAVGRNWIPARIFFFTSRNGAITAEERSWRRWWWHGECGWCANLFTEPTLTVALLASFGPLPSLSSSSFFCLLCLLLPIAYKIGYAAVETSAAESCFELPRGCSGDKGSSLTEMPLPVMPSLTLVVFLDFDGLCRGAASPASAFCSGRNVQKPQPVASSQ